MSSTEQQTRNRVTEILSTTDHRGLADHEAVIERGMNTFIEVGNALLAIREERLYRDGHATFEDYCRERWGFGRDYADRMIAAAAIVPTIVSTGLPAPTNEGQARELARVPEEDRADVWRETVERTDGKPTAAAIRETYTPTPKAAPANTWYAGPDSVRAPLPAGQDRADREVAHAEQQTASPPEPDPWTDEEHELHRQLVDGATIVVSLRGDRHTRLIDWAGQRNLFVRVDRRTEWGNPFEMPADGDRDTVIANYANHYLPHKPGLLAKLPDLQGKALGCWCAPEPCHGDVLKRQADQ